jgi:hypothetical protein
MESIMTDIATSVRAAIKQFGGTDAQADDAALVLECGMVGGVATLIATGTALNDPKSKQWLETNKPHLLPAKFERSLADRAFLDGNISARGTLVREVGQQEATRIAQNYGLKTLHDTKRGTRPDAVDGSEKKNGTADHRNNPWSNHQNNVDGRGRFTANALTRQGQIVKSLGLDKAAQMARAVNSSVGATRPSAS